MAVFRNKIDRGIPLLGQLYQLNPTTEGEEFLRLLGGESGTDYHASARWGGEHWDGEPAVRRGLAWAKRQTEVVLDALAGDMTLPRSAARELESVALRDPQFAVKSGGGHIPLREYDGDIVRLSKLVRVYEFHRGDPFAEFEWAVARDLVGLIDRAVLQGAGTAVGVCEECGSVYVNSERARRVRFCSYRCSHRRVQREKMRALRAW